MTMIRSLMIATLLAGVCHAQRPLTLTVTLPRDADGNIAADGEVRVPVVHEVMSGANLVGSDGASIPAIVHPETDHWLLRWKGLDDAQRSSATVAMIHFEDDGDGVLSMKPAVVQPSADHTLRLRACDATITGRLLRYEPQPHKHTVGYWADAKDTAAWTFETPTAGTYNVAVLQGCGTGDGGSTVTATLSGDSQGSMDFEVVETGHFQNFRWFDVGTVELQPGQTTLTLSAKRLVNNAIGDFREVQLTLVRP